MTNSGYDQIVRFFAGENALKKHGNAMRILFSEDGLRHCVKDWPAVEHFLLARLWEEAVSSQHVELFELYKEMSRSGNRGEPIYFQNDNHLPIMRLTLEKNSQKASFFTTITTLGTPLDLTTERTPDRTAVSIG